jgi:hypothetical protein
MDPKNEQEQQEKSIRMTMGAGRANRNGLKWENNSLNRKSIELSKNLQNNLYYIHPNNAMYNYHPPSRGLSNTESKLLLNPISNQNSVLPGLNFQPQKNESFNYNPYGINRVTTESDPSARVSESRSTEFHPKSTKKLLT